MAEHNEISADHRAKIEQIRQRLQHLLTDEFNTDFDILRWLQGHNFDVEIVTQKLKSHLRFRRAFDAKNYEWNRLMKEHFPFGVLGCTGKDNNLIFLDCTGRIDGEGVTRSISMTDIILTMICRMDTVGLPEMKKRESATGKQSGFILIMDMEGMNNNNVSVILNCYRQYGVFFTQHYAEIFQKILLVNAASYLYYIWRLLKPFLPERTSQKVEILSWDWKKELLQYVDADALPAHWGGTLKDENGDPMCRSKIIVPIKVPPGLYWKPGPDDPPKASLAQLSVGAGKHEFVSISVQEPGCFLRWYYFTDGDYSFGIYRAENESEFDTEVMDMVYPYFFVLAAASKVPEKGSLKCDRAGIYRIRFGNEHAWLMRMKVSHKIELVSEK